MDSKVFHKDTERSTLTKTARGMLRKQLHEIGGWCLLFALLWVTINVAQGVLIYYYVQTTVFPNPRNTINKTHKGYTAYMFTMFFFGGIWGLVNFAMVIIYFVRSRRWWASKDCTRRQDIAFLGFQIFVAVPIAAFIIIMPCFGGLIVRSILQRYEWNHHCDTFPMFAVLDGATSGDPSYVTTKAYFYAQGINDPLYTYELSNPDDDDVWTFKLRNWNAPQQSIPIDVYPTLQYVHYDFVNNTVIGNCTTPISSNGSTTTSLSCMSGTFDVGAFLALNITSAVPLNTTFGGASASSTSFLRAQDKQWSFSNDAPSLILRQINLTTGDLLEPVLRTAVTKVSDCSLLKVCLSGTGHGPASVVGGEVMAPLGLVLQAQMDYASFCGI